VPTLDVPNECKVKGVRFQEELPDQHDSEDVFSVVGTTSMTIESSKKLQKFQTASNVHIENDLAPKISIDKPSEDGSKGEQDIEFWGETHGILINTLEEEEEEEDRDSPRCLVTEEINRHDDSDSIRCAEAYVSLTEFPRLGLDFNLESTEDEENILPRVSRQRLSREFPLDPFPVRSYDSSWDISPRVKGNVGIYPSACEPNSYGSISSNECNIFRDRHGFPRRSDSMSSDITPLLSNNTHSRGQSVLGDQPDACSTSSEMTPILSINSFTSNSPKSPMNSFGLPNSLSPKTPTSFSSLGRTSLDGVLSEKGLKNVNVHSPSSGVILSSPGVRSPETLHKIVSREHNVEKLCKNLKGKKQPTSCHDFPFAAFFVLQLIAITCLCMSCGPMALGYVKYNNYDVGIGDEIKETTDTSAHLNLDGISFGFFDVLILIVVSGLISITISVFALAVMTAFTKHVIPIALSLSIILSFLWTAVGLIRGEHNFVPVTGLVAFGGSIAYTFTVWENIPFASANLYTALIAIRSCLPLMGLAFVFQIVAMLWSIVYFFASVGIYDKLEDCELDARVKMACYFAVAMSFVWTIQTLIHMMQVCIAGYIYRWWFKPKLDTSEQLDVIGESMVRAIVYSFGSICVGSLVVPISNFLRKIVEPLRPNGEETPFRALVVVQECIVTSIDMLFSEFHEFAFIYVGMYGYSFFDAGKQANRLFEKRGWTEIVDNDLLNNLLTIVSLVIGGTCGWIAIVVESSDRPALVSFCIGSVIGVTLSNILFSIITSSVNTVLCCFAGNPVEFRNNHPECSHVMREAWRESWPGCVDFVEGEHRLQSTIRSPLGRRRSFRHNGSESLFY